MKYQMKRKVLKASIKLMRLDRPVGFWLLLWPTLWALWLAAGGVPPLRWLALFTTGVFIMRAAGCVINDYADRHFDGRVQRTCQRPLPRGEISEAACLWLFSGLLLIAGLLLLACNGLTRLLAGIAFLLTLGYPFAKRVTQLPQVILGFAFSWSIPMVFAAVTTQLPQPCWLLLLATCCWVVAYDTQYARVDQEDDRKIGIYSTALLWGGNNAKVIGMLQLMMLGLLVQIGRYYQLGSAFYLSLIAAAGLFIYQQQLLAYQQPSKDFSAFTNNQYVGLLIFLGLAFSLS
ncbi:MAG: 4-hydroxybenzoate octaprenyltransferase [Candidatus Symbiodolus clandestinus]